MDDTAENGGGKFHRIVHVLTWIFFVPFSLAVFLVLGVSFFTTIYYDLNQGADLPRFGRENIPLLLLLTASVLGILYFLNRNSWILQGKSVHVYVQNHLLPGSRALRIALIWCTAVCMWLILMVRGLAVNDGLKLDVVINDFMTGNFHALTEPGGYLFLCPHQLGYVAIGQFLYLLFGASNYIVYQLLNMISILITIWMLYEIAWELFENRKICNLMAIMSMGMLFLYVYSTLVYNDIWSLAPEATSIYLMLRYLKYHRTGDAIWSSVLIGAAIVIKQNSFIAMAAMVVMMILDAVRELDMKKRVSCRNILIKRMLLIVLLVIVSKGITFCVDTAYVEVTGLKMMPKGEPATTYIAMGMHEGDGEWGWYNGYNVDTYGNSGFDWNLANQTAISNIKERIAEFSDRPLHGGRFYLRKFLTQWADPTCISMRNLELTSRHVDGQPELMYSVIYGKGRTLFSWIMNVYQMVVYIGTGIYCIGIFRSRRFSFYQALPVLFILGGMVFHELWEGSSRYTIRYFVMMLPYASYGIYQLVSIMNGENKRESDYRFNL
ncbi:MAG: glycosyltransferase family 39 protein [Butyrivibrio sp.]|jgi:hypothetical protein|nr:glycosyltransferase family 39 protein [Butyrivibrio sp.]